MSFSGRLLQSKDHKPQNTEHANSEGEGSDDVQVSLALTELASFEKETLLTPAMIVATAFDRAVTVRERDPDS